MILWWYPEVLTVRLWPAYFLCFFPKEVLSECPSVYLFTVAAEHIQLFFTNIFSLRKWGSKTWHWQCPPVPSLWTSLSFYSCCWTHPAIFLQTYIFIKIMGFKDLALAVSTSAKSLNLIIFVQLLLNTSSYFFKKIFIKIVRFEDLALAVSTSAKSLNLIIFVQLLPSYFFTHMFSLR